MKPVEKKYKLSYPFIFFQELVLFIENSIDWKWELKLKSDLIGTTTKVRKTNQLIAHRLLLGSLK